MTFEVIFFDGASAQPRAALLTVHDRSWTLVESNSNKSNGRHWSENQMEIEHYRVGARLLVKVAGEEIQLQASDEVADQLYHLLRHRETVFQQFYSWMHNLGPVRIVGLGLIVMVGLILAYTLLISPAIGRLAASLIPLEKEASLGHRMADQFLEDWSIDEDKSELLNEFIDLIRLESDYPIRTYVVEQPVANALAFPGGTIVVFDSIITLTEGWQQLAALLAHELAHINRRHTLETICRNLSTYFLISVLSGDVGGVSGILIENASKLEQLAYSRSLESEADKIGVEYLVNAGIDPGSMGLLFDKLHASSEDSRILNFLSTHPLGESRTKSLPQSAPVHHEPEFANQAKVLYELLKE